MRDEIRPEIKAWIGLKAQGEESGVKGKRGEE